MLVSLEARDFVHLAQASLQLPDTGYCVLTGETGVGKSLLIDALALALGGRLSREAVREGATQAQLSAGFRLADDSPAAGWLQQRDLPCADGEVVLRRVIDANRRSRAYINGTLVPLAQLAELAGHLISICGQHEHMQLLQPAGRRRLLDAAAGAIDDAAATAQAYTGWQQACDRHARATDQAEQGARRIAELEHELEQIELAGVSAENLEENNRLLSLHGNAAELAQAHAELAEAIDQVSALLSERQNAAERLAEIDASLAELASQHATLLSLAEDLRRDLGKVADSVGQVDQEALAGAESFLAEAHRLARRYKLASVESLPAHAGQLRAELAQCLDADAQQTQALMEAALEQLRAAAAGLTARRARTARPLGTKVQKSLRLLGMPEARFAIDLAALDEVAGHGAEEVVYSFAARRKGALGALADVASGGELSRVFLALYTHASGADGRDLVFDEVDTGVGGKAAAQVGSLLAALGKRRLVLCVTHLPQVAAAASHHWRVATTDDGLGSFAAVEGEQREEEIARMLAGRKVTAASRANARDILAAAAA